MLTKAKENMEFVFANFSGDQFGICESKFQMCITWSSNSSRELSVEIIAQVSKDIGVYTMILNMALFKTVKKKKQERT